MKMKEITLSEHFQNLIGKSYKGEKLKPYDTNTCPRTFLA